MGRIPAQTAKQVIIQKIRAGERDSIFTEYAQRRGEIVNGVVGRFDGGVLVVNLTDRVEAILPKSEQISGESHHPGERIRAMILEVREASNQVKIVLCERPIYPSAGTGGSGGQRAVIEIKALAREAGIAQKSRWIRG